MIKRTIIILLVSSAFVALAFISGIAPAPGMHGDHAQGHGQHGMPGHSGMHDMHMMPVESELDFIAGMIPHHQEAVDSAQELLDVTERSEMRELAEAIIAAQTEEIAMMQGWLEAWYPDADTEVVYQPMMRPLAALSPEAADRAFLEDMIMHHMMAIMMAQDVLALDGVRDEVRSFAEAVIADQSAENQQMMQWLRDWYGVTPMMDMPHHGH
jgi:uncharacterized protein (DUF305 family)